MRISGGLDESGAGMVSELRAQGLGWQGAVRTGLAFALCVLMVDQPLLAAGNTDKRGPTAVGTQSKGESRVLHALDRLTFGPRPGDVAAVEAMGLTTWFEMQLNPEKIDDTALEGRLAQFPAMQLPQAELMAKYPGQQVIRQLAQRTQQGQMAPAAGGFGARRGRFAPQAAPQEEQAVLNDPVERAIYADQMAFYREQQERKTEKDASAAASGAQRGVQSGANGMNAGAMDSQGGQSAGQLGEQLMSDGTVAPNGNASGAQTPAPIVRRAPQAQSASAGATDAGMGAGVPDYAAMAAGTDNAMMLPNSDVRETGQAPDAHVEKLFKDLEAVKIINLPPEERMRRVLAMAPNDFVAFRESLSAAEVVQFAQGLSGQQREIFAAMQNSTRMVGAEEMQERLLRDIESNRQLEAVMTDFWLNHFNVYVRKNGQEPYLIPSYEREVIRPNALGKFEDLLVATARSPAMQMYLDNWQSIGPDSQAAKAAKNGAERFGQGRFGAQAQQLKAAAKDRGLNENYARELMELHTLGVNGGYAQKDVTEVAKVFTGWTIDQPFRGGTFNFDERRHEPGTKTVLGKEIKEGGMNEGLEVLHMLATSPVDGEVHLDQAGRAVCERRPSRGAGGPDDTGVSEVRWRHQDGAAHDVRFAGVLGAGDGAVEGEDAGGVCGVGGAGERCGGEQHAGAGAGAGQAGNAAVRDADAEWLLLDERAVGEHRRAGEPDELRAGDGG